MATYVPSQADSVSTRVGPPPLRSATPTHSSHPPTSAPSGATVSAYVPSSALRSDIHHHTPLQPNRHHPLPDNSWHHHHARLKENHLPPRRLPPPPPQPSQVQSHHAMDEKSPNLESQSILHTRSDNRQDEQSHHMTHHAPETPHSYHHTVNVVASHHPASQLDAPTHQTSYIYPIHPLVAPVAHVPIGAAHYAHLPPSIWSPPHAQYHQHPHTQPHQLPPPHHVVPTPHGQLPYAASHLHHISAPTHPSAHAYALPASHTPTTPHPPPTTPSHTIHAAPHHSHQHMTYTYAQVQAPSPAHRAVKTTVAVSPSQPVAIPGPVPYTMSAAHLPQAAVGAAVSAQMPCKTDIVPVHASHTEPPPPQSAPGLRPAGKAAKSYDMKNISELVQISKRTDEHADTGPPGLSKDRSLPREEIQAYSKAPDQRRESSQKEKEQLAPGQSIRKPRKPYTIKKSREVWTQEEHRRFLQALQLYDRDWKKIEAYIGSKTVLQIRSHAQKHFGKVTKYKTGEYIPPPRPKKRAALPYPRSRSAGQSKSTSANSSTADKTAGDENSVQRTRSPNAKNGMGGIRVPTDGKQGSSKRTDKINETRTNAPIVLDTHSKQLTSKPPHVAEVEAGERRSGSILSGDKYALHSYEQQNDNGDHKCAQPGKVAQVNSPSRRRPTPGSEERVRDQASSVPQGSSGSTDIKRGISSYTREAHTHHQRNSSYTNDLEERGNLYKGDQHGVTSQRMINSDHKSVSQLKNDHSPKRLSFRQSVEHDTSTIKEMRRNGTTTPNNSLLVLSNCVDLMSRDALPERQPAAGWATAAAARRAHRARTIRARKPPLPQPLIPMQTEDPAHGGTGNSPRREILDSDILDEQSSRYARDHNTVMKRGSSRLGSRSPPVNSPLDYGSDQAPPDPQRSSAGSGVSSDDAIAGFSSSDRPSVSGSAAGSGTGGSLETSDAGDPEEDPKSSNDGSSGDDRNRRSPPTRDSSPADPNSSGSRENSPNECLPPRPSTDGSSEQVKSTLRKASQRNGVAADRYEHVCHGDKTNTDSANVGIGSSLSHGDHHSDRYRARLEQNDGLPTNGNNPKLRSLPQAMLSANHNDQMLPHNRPTQVDGGSRMRQNTVHKLSPSSKKRQHTSRDYDTHGRTDGRIGESGRDLESKRQRTGQNVQEANYSENQTHHGRDHSERNR